MNKEVQALALVYAQTLVEYYQAKAATGADADTVNRKAYNRLIDVQNDLAYAAEKAAAL